MDAREIRQLNQYIAAEYACQNDSAWTLCGDNTQLSIFLGNAEQPETFSGKSLWQLVPQESRPLLEYTVTEQLNAGTEIECVMPLSRSDGSVVWVLNRARRTADGTYLTGVFTEITYFKRMCDEQRTLIEQYRDKLSQTEDIVNVLQIRAERDSLTGVFNASTTRSMCEKYLAESDARCALVILDSDNFKSVNDTYGHMVGDHALVRMAAVIQKLFRANDIVGRVGGDEFLVLMKDVPNSEIVYKRCNQIVDAIRDIRDPQLPKGFLKCSVGVVLSDECSRVYDQMFCCADRALYQAKAMGGNRFVMGRPE